MRTSYFVSDTFSCPTGLRQGCSLSPILFVLFIDELYTKLRDNNTRGVQLLPNMIEIFLLMFADDIAMISDTIVGLQRQLNILCDFCTGSKLVVNVMKTKIMVFKRDGRLSNHEKWSYDNYKLDVVNGFNYVGLYFTNRLSLFKMANVTY